MPEAPPVDYLTELPPSADLVVIGGGVVGAATAFYAARSGFRPLLLEKRPALCTLTTPASTGAFRLQFDNREELRLVRRSIDLFMQFAEQTGRQEFDLRITQPGYLWLTSTDGGAERQEALVDRQRSWGLDDIELLDGDEARKRFPYLSPEVTQARYRAADGFLDPKALTMGLVAGSQAQVCLTTEAAGFKISGGRLVSVQTNRGTVDAPLAVIAAGPFSGVLAQTAGLDLGLRTPRRHKLILPDVPQVPAWAPMTIDEDFGGHWRPGLKGAFLLHTDPQAPTSPPSDDPPTDHRFYDQLLDPASPVSVARLSPFWREVWEQNTADWVLQAGQYAETPDHRPLIGESPIDGLYLNTGYSGHGVMAAPGGASLLADLLQGYLAPEDNPFRPDRDFSDQKQDVL
ncbi:MAG: FAD-binding oxidoreductase [Anaerolineales bacterium]|nr:FAD-binding oxidoreductase [Anaerolineales bacterium]